MMNNRANWQDLLWAGICAGLALCLASWAHALDTNEVQFGEGSNYDGKVRIERDASGRMLFQDTALTTPVSLSDLNQALSQ
ncbi:MAG: hypothetical protein ACOC29_04080, partial [Candidatus Sumerlaeota bacterium]